MSAIAPVSWSYTEYANLGNQVANSEHSLEDAAKHFESLFIGMWLKSARDANAVFADDGLFGGDEMQMRQEMFDRQMAVHLAQHGGIGLAPTIVRQLGGDGAEPAALDTPADSSPRLSTLTMPSSASVAPLSGDHANLGVRTAMFANAEAFLEEIGPRIKEIAARIGLPPVALAAQAALETGWGSQVIQSLSGELSHNLFGLKSNGAAQPSIEIHSKEYVLGQWTDRLASFRAYPDWTSSIEDYADFVSNSARYKDAVAQNNAQGYVDALQAGGYATDPKYAVKLKNLMQRLTGMGY